VAFSAMDLSSLEDQLNACALKSVGPLELSSRGFITPFGDGELMARRVGDSIWISVGTEDKLLPSSVVNDLLQKKLTTMEQQEGRRPGGRARKRLKEDIVHELLPRAFVRPGRVDAFLLLSRDLVVVDTSSRKQAEMVVSELRNALGSFPALPLNAEIAPRAVLTGWIAGEPLPDGLTLGDEATLKDAADKGASIKATRQELTGEEIGKHLEAGKQVTRLALMLGDHVSFSVGEDLVVRKFKLLDGAVQKLESTDAEDLCAELDARFALCSAEIGEVFDALMAPLKFSEAG
jgi:recombination associated protein RdgC